MSLSLRQLYTKTDHINLQISLQSAVVSRLAVMICELP